MLCFLIAFKLGHKLLPCHICLEAFYFHTSVFSMAYVDLLHTFLRKFLAKNKACNLLKYYKVI